MANGKSSKTASKSDNTVRITVRLDDKMYERLKYWADKNQVSVNQYVAESIDMKIAYENKDYPLATLEQARLNQLIDEQASLASNIKSLESVIISGFDSLLNLTRGDNYLLDDENGNL